MNKTSITAARPAPRPALPPPERTGAAGSWFGLRKTLEILASLKLTVVLFALAIVLVFFGTIAQKDEGTWTVLHRYFRTGIAWIPFQIFARFGQVFFNLPNSVSLPGRFPFPGGWLLGGLLLVNVLAAHIVRFRVDWKRSGILLLHAGLIVLMLSEIITGLFAIEWRMPIKEGGSSNYLEEARRTELAIISRSGSGKNTVVAIPGSFLEKGERIRNEDLPFDVEVVRYMSNSSFPAPPEGGEENPATAGDGLKAVALDKAEVPGTGEEEDRPSAYVTFFQKGTDKPLGTYLMSTWWCDDNPLFPGLPQKVKVGGKEYDVFLRFKRSYLPFTIHLLEFRHDRYMGTDIDKNYSSRIRVIDPASGQDREVVISMNNPLRFGGKTFYQARVLEGDKGTILQVVDNPGWLVPYISCCMIALGLIFHFGLHLVGFLRRRAAL